MRGTLIWMMVAILVAGAAGADEVLLGQPTIGDLNRYNFGEVIKAGQRAAIAKQEFNAAMGDAREQFFTTDFKSAAHKAAEVKFARLLQDKDRFYLIFCLTGGVQDGLSRMAGAGLLTGGGGAMPDNGISRLALPAFARWVNAVRATLGAKTERQLLVLVDESAIAKALDANFDSYARYKVERDKGEFLQRKINACHEDNSKRLGRYVDDKVYNLAAIQCTTNQLPQSDSQIQAMKDRQDVLDADRKKKTDSDEQRSTNVRNCSKDFYASGSTDEAAFLKACVKRTDSAPTGAATEAQPAKTFQQKLCESLEVHMLDLRARHQTSALAKVEGTYNRQCAPKR